MKIFHLIIWLGFAMISPLYAQVATMGYRIEDPKITQSISVIDILLQEKKMDQAVAESEKLYQQFPDNPRVFSKLVALYQEIKAHQKLLVLYQKKLALNPANSDITFKLAEYYLEQNLPQETTRRLDYLLVSSNYNFIIIQLIFEKCIAWGLNDYAVQMVTETRKKLKRPALLAFEMATIYDLEGNDQATLNEYILFLTTPENEPGYYTRKEYVRQTLQERIKARPELIETLRKKIAPDKANPDLILFLANLYYEMGQFQTAFDSYIREDQRQKSGGNITFQFANYCLEKQDYQHGIDILRYIESNYQQDFTIQIGKCFENLNVPDSAIRYYQMVLTQSPSQPAEQIEASFRLSRIYEEIKFDLPQALTYMNQVNSEGVPLEMAGDIQLSRARLLMKTGQFKESQSLLQELIHTQQSPEFSPGDACFFLGKSLLYQKQYLNATPYFQKVMANYPKSRYFNDLIRLFSILQRIEDNLPMLGDLVDAEWANETCKFDESEKLYVQFISQYPQFSELQKIYLRLIEVLAKTRKDSILKQYALQGIAIKPESFEAMFMSYELAEWYTREKEYASAHKLFQIILRSSNGIALKSKVRQRLEELRLHGFIES